jgi:FkbM family methyltransferase
MKYILKLLLFFVDFNHKKKIINFFKIREKDNKITIIDVGAHEGETIYLFSKNLNLKKMICYEASKVNFKRLKNLKNKFKNFDLEINNIALGSEKKEMNFFQTSESSSSTFCKIDEDSNYFKRKKKILDFFYKSKYIINSELIKLDTIENEFNRYNLKKADILKIDTEGFEFDVIKGAHNQIKKIKYIYFEHHYDSMIIKDYTFRDVNKYLNQFNFTKALKIKMPFRKTFEYIYINKDLK